MEQTDESLSFSAPRMMFQTPWDIGRTYEVFPEGVGRDNHFLFVDAARQNDTQLHAVLNWTRLLDPE